MTRKLFEIINALDNKFDVEIQDYFKLSIDDREELAQIIANNLVESSNKIPVVIHSYIVTIHRLLNQMILDEEFEKCDLFTRIQKKLFDTIDT